MINNVLERLVESRGAKSISETTLYTLWFMDKKQNPGRYSSISDHTLKKSVEQIEAEGGEVIRVDAKVTTQSNHVFLRKP